MAPRLLAKFVACLEGAGSSLVGHLAAVIVAGSGLACPGGLRSLALGFTRSPAEYECHPGSSLAADATLRLAFDLEVSVIGADCPDEGCRKPSRPAGRRDAARDHRTRPARPRELFGTVGTVRLTRASAPTGSSPATKNSSVGASPSSMPAAAEFGAHASSQRASLEKALHRRGEQSFQGDVYDGPRCQLATACCGKRPEREPHCGAAPVTACSESGTWNIDCARWPCWASQATTSLGEGAATSTPSPGARRPLGR